MLVITLLSTLAYADPAPHFLILMQNLSQKDVTLRFQPGIGNVYLQPTLPDQTPLPAGQMSSKYGVYIDPLTPFDTFSIVFTGQKDCSFTIGFYAPADPTVSISGPGCDGGGYQIVDNGGTLLLFVSDIHY